MERDHGVSSRLDAERLCVEFAAYQPENGAAVQKDYRLRRHLLLRKRISAFVVNTRGA